MANLKEKIGITEVSALQRWVRSRCGVYYRVTFKLGEETAYVTEHGEMVIPTPNSNMTLRDAIRLRGFGLHEMGHPKWQPDIFKIMRANPVPQGHPLGNVFNVLLDVHSESLTASEYVGDAKALSEFGAVVGHDVYDKLTKALKVSGNVFPDGFEKMAGVLIAGRNAEGSWNVGMMVGFEKLVNEVYPKEARDIAEDLERKFKLTEVLVDNGKDVNEYGIFDLSKQIYQYLWDKDPEQEIANAKAKGSGKGDPTDGKEEKEGAGGTGNKYGEGGTEEATPATDKIKVEELLHSNHYETLTGGGNGVGFDYTNRKGYAKYTPVDPATFKITSYAKRGR